MRKTLFLERKRIILKEKKNITWAEVDGEKKEREDLDEAGLR